MQSFKIPEKPLAETYPFGATHLAQPRRLYDIKDELGPTMLESQVPDGRELFANDSVLSALLKIRAGEVTPNERPGVSPETQEGVPESIL
jgi:hypothetical protein